MFKWLGLIALTFCLNAYADSINTLDFEPHVKKSAANCSNTGMADSHVLALSSQAGFCETYGFEAGKPECLKLPKESYQARHLTLHGLWPNLDSCGQRYGYCGVYPQYNHCHYDPLALSEQTSSALKQFMPSYFYGSCLERHEWNKHGSCQNLSSDEYFSLAIRLVNEADQSIFGQFLSENQGQTVKMSQLKTVIEQSFGLKNVNKINLGCKNGILVDIYIHLPALMPNENSLTSLINEAPDYFAKELCGSKIKISRFHNENALY